jgi:hypothetical protein
MVVLFRLSPFPWANFGWEGSPSRVAYRRSGKGEGPYPTGGVGYPWLAHLRLLAACVSREFAWSSGWDVLSAFVTRFFAKKWDNFFGGIPPAIAPEGDLVFGEKDESPFDFIQWKIYVCTIDWGVGYAKDSEILSKGRSDVAVGYSCDRTAQNSSVLLPKPVHVAIKQ